MSLFIICYYSKLRTGAIVFPRGLVPRVSRQPTAPSRHSARTWRRSRSIRRDARKGPASRVRAARLDLRNGQEAGNDHASRMQLWP